jgi:thiamine biosynthesis protein ThiI
VPKYVISYGEIGLKGDNRLFFEGKLVKNIRESLKDLGRCEIKRTWGRIMVESDGESHRIEEKLSKVFGIMSYSPVLTCSKNMEEIKETVKASLGGKLTDGASFKVETRRSDKSFPLKSPEINGALGGYVLTEFPGIRVDVHNPDITIHIEIREKALIYSKKFKGLGGLPVGTGGKGMALLSGGIDSPVAAWMLMKRGVTTEGIYFHSFPYTGDKAKEKVVDLARILSKYSNGFKLHVINFTPIQQVIGEKCPDKMVTIIMRRMMMRIAQKVAVRRRCKVLITGESVGQVASQTLESLNTTNAVVTLPVMRPLIGMDKLEIIDRAQSIGTFETSILPYEDCCALFVPKHPKTKPTLEEAVQGEEGVDWIPLIEEAVKTRETIKVSGVSSQVSV